MQIISSNLVRPYASSTQAGEVKLSNDFTMTSDYKLALAKPYNSNYFDTTGAQLQLKLNSNDFLVDQNGISLNSQSPHFISTALVTLNNYTGDLTIGKMNICEINSVGAYELNLPNDNTLLDGTELEVFIYETNSMAGKQINSGSYSITVVSQTSQILIAGDNQISMGLTVKANTLRALMGFKLVKYTNNNTSTSFWIASGNCGY